MRFGDIYGKGSGAGMERSIHVTQIWRAGSVHRELRILPEAGAPPQESMASRRHDATSVTRPSPGRHLGLHSSGICPINTLLGIAYREGEEASMPFT